MAGSLGPDAAAIERYPRTAGTSSRPISRRCFQWLNQSFDYVIEVLPKLTDEQLQAKRFKVDFSGGHPPNSMAGT
jgi:hypothetical protein